MTLAVKPHCPLRQRCSGRAESICSEERVISALRGSQKGLSTRDAREMSKGALTSSNRSDIKIFCPKITATSETFFQQFSSPSFFLISLGPLAHMLLIFCLFKALCFI